MNDNTYIPTVIRSGKTIENMSKRIIDQTGGFGFFGLLAIAFIVLKLCRVIDWSWWWILSPIWIPIGITLVSVFIFLIYMIIKNSREG